MIGFVVTSEGEMMPDPYGVTTREAAGDLRNCPIQRERMLVNECMRGSDAAWERLFAEYHPAMLRAVRAALGGRASDSELTEEIAARLWCSLADEQGRRLGQFDARRRCRLSTYFFVIARSAVRQHFRAERRRRTRERVACDARPRGLLAVEASAENLLFEEFVNRLSPREEEFFRRLMPSPGDADVSFSQTNAWQLNHRVRRKFKAFLEEGRA